MPAAQYAKRNRHLMTITSRMPVEIAAPRPWNGDAAGVFAVRRGPTPRACRLPDDPEPVGAGTGWERP